MLTLQIWKIAFTVIEPNLALPNWPKWNKEIASVLNYGRNNFGKTSSLITEAEVRAERAKLPAKKN